MLEKERFLAIKKLAKEIREEYKKEFESFNSDTVEEVIKDKDDLIDSIIEKMGIAFSEGEKGKEEKQIFRANLLIPDDMLFFSDYSKDKNIRNLMNKYEVGIEDIMSKITELNIYSKFIDTFNEKDEYEPIEETEDPKEERIEPIESFEEPKTETIEPIESFEEPDAKIKEAENLLDEIEDLSQSMEDFNIGEKEETIEPDVKTKETEIYNFDEPNEEIEITDEIESIGAAVSDFVDEYTKVKKELEFTQAKISKFNSEKEELRNDLTNIKNEKESVERENSELKQEIEQMRSEIQKAKEEIDSISNENKSLKAKVDTMEKTNKQSTDLLKEIYQSIPKKRFNTKDM